MNGVRLLVPVAALLLVACQTAVDRETIATLRHMHVEVREEVLEGGMEKAMESYQHFLAATPESALTPEAIRRMADLKIEREYGYVTGGASDRVLATSRPERLPSGGGEAPANSPLYDESEGDFERRATLPAPESAVESGDDLERAGALEAIALYRKLLDEYPLYDRNDQVLYQMSRAYEELGRVEEAMEIMDRLVREYPRSRYLDEVQFRRAEYFFTHRRFLDAEDAYARIVEIGVASSFYQLALYKLGWTFYKQDLYEDALHRFIDLLDYKVSVGHDFDQTADEQERKRLEDTFRVISLSFSNLGGADSVVEYFSRHGQRAYEDGVYSNLAEFYVDKRRYADATATYNAFVSRNPFHEKSPHFHMRVIEIHTAGGFPTLVLESKKAFATTYGLHSDYWRHFEPGAYPEVLAYLKTNLTDLANHYHALYQDPQLLEEKGVNFREALHWYGEFLASFPAESESPGIHFQMADLLLENRSFARAAVEYEKTAYDYPRHDKASAAGYAAVFAHREHLGTVAPQEREPVRREVVRSSLKFADTFPEHDKAPVVLGAAADDLYDMKAYEEGVTAAQTLIDGFPGAAADVRRSAWLVVAHASYELLRYAESESAYVKVLELLPEGDAARDGLVDNLAAAIYRQGEKANSVEDYRGAADHFLRVGRMAPTSAIRASAEYDGAVALIQLQDWSAAAAVLTAFRDTFPGHALQPEITKKIAYVYREDGRLSSAAEEYERIERESRDDEVRREALLIAAQLHEEAGSPERTLEVYRRYVDTFPRPVELHIETRHKIALILEAQSDRDGYLDELGRIVAADASAGGERTARTRYLAAKAALVLAEPAYHRFVAVKLEKPFEKNLRRKRDLMKAATQEFGRLVEYEIGEVTAAATFYLAEIYGHFSTALMESERPDNLTPLELELYELAIEEQAYPFEEQAITVHRSNHELIAMGIYNAWVDKSMRRLAELVPARYAKEEEGSAVVASLSTYVYEIEGSPAETPVEEGAAVESDSPEAAIAEGADEGEMTEQATAVEGEFTAEDAKSAKKTL